MEQQKSGMRDTHAHAKSQNDVALDALGAAYRRTKSIILEADGKLDITDQIDLATATPDVARTVGPAGKGFDESLGLTASDLTRLIKDLVVESKNPNRADGAK